MLRVKMLRAKMHNAANGIRSAVILAAVAAAVGTGGCSRFAPDSLWGWHSSERGLSAEDPETMIAPESELVKDDGVVSMPETDGKLPEAMGADGFPVRYDARDYGRAAPVRDQGELGTCWAFASLSALESSLLPEKVFDFSEDHISHNPNFLLGQSGGGEYTMAMAYLLSWQGPVTEEQDPYGDGISPEGLSAVCHVQEVRILPEYDRAAIKRAILAWGGVESSLYMSMSSGQDVSEFYRPDTAAYCYPEKTAANHDVVIVGWDNDFPKEAFGPEVRENGAYLCENSWGESFGDKGFFYVSYEDANIGMNNVVYSGVEDPENRTILWQSDLCGWIGQLGYGTETAWAANVYTAEVDSIVDAAGFYATMPETDYEVYFAEHISENTGSLELMNRRKVAEGHLKDAGFYTIPFTKEYALDAGDRFAVEIRLTTPGAVHPIAIEYDSGDGKGAIDLSDGEGYVSADGNIWDRAEEKNGCNVCLKAYGKMR